MAEKILMNTTNDDEDLKKQFDVDLIKNSHTVRESKSHKLHKTLAKGSARTV